MWSVLDGYETRVVKDMRVELYWSFPLNIIESESSKSLKLPCAISTTVLQIKHNPNPDLIRLNKGGYEIKSKA